MEEQQQHVALPKLYGAPAYARPPLRVEVAPRPLDPDDLPIAAYQTEEERVLSESFPEGAYIVVTANGHGGQAEERQNGGDKLHGRPFLLRAIAGRLLGGDS